LFQQFSPLSAHVWRQVERNVTVDLAGKTEASDEKEVMDGVSSRSEVNMAVIY
jgi:hypothetical protein